MRMPSVNDSALLRFRVLGPLRLCDTDEQERFISAGKLRILLSRLLLCPNQWVSVDQLIDVLWEIAPSRHMYGNVKTYVWQLRRILPGPPAAGSRIESRRGAYRLMMGSGELDVHTFSDLARRGE